MTWDYSIRLSKRKRHLENHAETFEGKPSIGCEKVKSLQVGLICVILVTRI